MRWGYSRLGFGAEKPESIISRVSHGEADVLTLEIASATFAFHGGFTKLAKLGVNPGKALRLRK